MRVEMDDAYITDHEKEALLAERLLPLLEAVSTGKPLVIVAEDVEGEAWPRSW